MDPQVQGVLSSAAERWPHIHISDSLVMADRAVKMVEEGCTTVAVLGVDFMSENVRAILDEAGHQDVKVRCCKNECHLKHPFLFIFANPLKGTVGTCLLASQASEEQVHLP